MADREYEGDPLDGTVQYITERPALEEDAEDVAYATDPEPDGEATVEDVPLPSDDATCAFPGCSQPVAETGYCADCRAACRGGDA